jgi:hypothetical protein
MAFFRGLLTRQADQGLEQGQGEGRGASEQKLAILHISQQDSQVGGSEGSEAKAISRFRVNQLHAFSASFLRKPDSIFRSRKFAGMHPMEQGFEPPCRGQSPLQG